MKLGKLKNGIRYIIDENADGIYDIFQNNEGQETDLGQENGKYLIDINGDGNWNYVYSTLIGLEDYNKSEKLEPSWIIILLIVIAISINSTIIFLYKKIVPKD